MKGSEETYVKEVVVRSIQMDIAGYIDDRTIAAGSSIQRGENKIRTEEHGQGATVALPPIVGRNRRNGRPPGAKNQTKQGKPKQSVATKGSGRTLTPR